MQMHSRIKIHTSSNNSFLLTMTQINDNSKLKSITLNPDPVIDIN